MKPEVKARLTWITLYKETSNAGVVCRHSGISRPTLRKWWKRYLAYGVSRQKDRSRHPHFSPNKEEQLILLLRQKRNLGARRMMSVDNSGAHNDKTPKDKYSELSEATPFWDEVHEGYFPEKEHLQNQNYKGRITISVNHTFLVW